MLVHNLINQGQSNSIVFKGAKPITYKKFQTEVTAFRNYFHDIGIRRGENVGLFSRNSVEYVCSYMAIASLGAVVVPLNFQLSAREVAFIVKDAQMQRLVTMDKLELEEALQHYEYEQELQQLVITEFQPTLRQNTFEQAPGLQDFDENQPCVIIYTSGTTGNPKGAVLTHKNLVSNAEAFQQVLHINSSDNVLCVLPMYHCFAWTCSILNSLFCGASITILDAFSPKETVAVIKEQGVTVVFGVPPIYNILARLAAVKELARVRIFVSGGASLPVKIAQQFERAYGVNLIEGYGLSEASPVVAINPPERTKYSSIGKALPGLEVKIVDENGEARADDEVGELIVRGPSVMKGYFNLPAETLQALRGGWLHTGDLAYKDSDGYYFIVDRLKDMIITNGENIYPREIEELLYAYPGIVETAVIGVPDSLRGQQAAAYIVLAEGIELDRKSIREYLSANLAAYKIPKDFIVVDSLPKTSTGKILKRQLQELIK
ncbi:long-chain-fatty-acid--CoA ligase [Sporomusaceae bacterium FL31]|nr:long-chain-fatty-acid--CoA ligase [Sporomusaceae bacterium FL31]GCE35465.1 long-chain-fatty-acid--CoA ligase [Sporomusaceae bacterium]